MIHKINKKQVIIADPGVGIVKLTTEEFFGEVQLVVIGGAGECATVGLSFAGAATIAGGISIIIDGIKE